MRAVMLALLVTLIAAPSPAQELETIRALADRCRAGSRLLESNGASGDGYLGPGMCIGFLTAASQVNGSLASPIYCAPAGVTFDQRSRIFVAWADKHPELLHLPAYWGVTASMKTAFPCN